ncbi:Afadin and alpha-actinin-binding-domain-containing protein [Irpex rosettiformis]|uniref:Afadin and alpha-actinin-binding-domain-containing protein n=1 Tax=Irpex rosettiformis TaxID=378272 RepID=A0ACB8UBP8_9APHY|nr:Afadin and alpha-actinin-binding-domain-containing protein [Irpex rosettiformis]
MAATPKKLVHWALDLAKSPSVDSPGSEGSSTDSCSSSLPYINSQLIAHGYTHQPGISLDGTSKDDAERVVKCLLSMLSQRIDDISRTEDLSTKIRTLSYDHERLLAMYRGATETAANAEREMNLHKSRFASANRTLQSTENAHKQTTLELQRTRTALQAIRSTHQAEIKRLEKEKDKILDRWTKLADAQLNGSLNRSGPSSGFRCANAAVVEASEVQLRGRGTDLLEAALEQAARARHDLLEENERLKGVIMSSANELQRTVHTAQRFTGAEVPDEPPVLTSMELFPFAPANAAWEILSSLFDSLKQQFEPLMNSESLPGSSTAARKSQEDKESEERSRAREVGRLQAVIANLTSELNDAQTQSKTYAAQAKEMFERFAEEQRVTNATIHSKIVAAQDEENERLTQREQELEEERQRLTEAVIKLGTEKAALEAERIQFLEERRNWQVQAIMSDISSPMLSNEAGPSTSFAQHLPPEAQSSPKPSPTRSSRKSPRKSKSSISVGVSGAKKPRVPRRSSGAHKVKGKGKEKAAFRVIPSFETEVIAPRSTQAQPSFKTKMTTSQPQPPKAIVPAFVLPPPSPAAQLPSRDSIFTNNPIPPLPKIDFSGPSSHSTPDDTPPDEVLQTQSAQPVAGSSTAANPPLQPPTTPGVRRPFPMAKPLAPHMIHAYSPVKPSPLSRILRLGNSPDSPEPLLAAPALGPLTEQDESIELSPTPAFRHARFPDPPMSLAAELGVSEDDDTPLRDRVNGVKELPPRPSSSLGRYPAAKDKGKGKAQPVTLRTTGSGAREPVAAAEKPKTRSKSTTGPTLKTPKVIGGGVAKKAMRMTTRSATASAAAGPSNLKPATKPPPTKGGPRRVPIGSSKAAAMPTWKG